MSRGRLRGGTCVWRFAGPLMIVPMLLCGWIFLRLHVIYKHLVEDVTGANACTNSSAIPAIGAPLPLRSRLVMGVQHAKLDAKLRTSSSLGTPSSIYSVCPRLLLLCLR
jgi:hypothetical protein